MALIGRILQTSGTVEVEKKLKVLVLVVVMSCWSEAHVLQWLKSGTHRNAVILPGPLNK